MNEGARIGRSAARKLRDLEESSHFRQDPSQTSRPRHFGRDDVGWFIVTDSTGSYSGLSDPDSAALKPCGSANAIPCHFLNAADGLNGCYKPGTPVEKVFDPFGLALVLPGKPVLLRRNRWNGRLETCTETNLIVTAKYTGPGATLPHSFEIVEDGNDTGVSIELDFGSSPAVGSLHTFRFERSLAPTYWADCNEPCGRWVEIQSGGGAIVCPNGFVKNSSHTGIIQGNSLITVGSSYTAIADGKIVQFIASTEIAAGVDRNIIVLNHDNCQLEGVTCCIDQGVVVTPSCPVAGETSYQNDFSSGAGTGWQFNLNSFYWNDFNNKYRFGGTTPLGSASDSYIAFRSFQFDKNLHTKITAEVDAENVTSLSSIHGLFMFDGDVRSSSAVMHRPVPALLGMVADYIPGSDPLRFNVQRYANGSPFGIPFEYDTGVSQLCEFAVGLFFYNQTNVNEAHEIHFDDFEVNVT